MDNWIKSCIDAVTAESMKIAADSLRRNAENASATGLEVTVTRTYDGVGLSNGRECKWCKDRECTNATLEEAYRIGAFQRHEGCECIIEYRSNKGIRTIQTGKYTGWNFADELEKRKSAGMNEQFFADELASRVDRYIDYDPVKLVEEAKSGKFYEKVYARENEKTKPELEKSIKRYIKQIEEHEWKIQNPERYMTKQDPNDPVERSRAIEIWENHRKRNARYAKIALEIWREKYG